MKINLNTVLVILGGLGLFAPDVASVAAWLASMHIAWLSYPVRGLGMLAVFCSSAPLVVPRLRALLSTLGLATPPGAQAPWDPVANPTVIPTPPPPPVVSISPGPRGGAGYGDKIVALLVLAACLDCSVPVQPPVPPAPSIDAPAGHDVFAGQVFDCRGLLVMQERANSLEPVGDCLVSSFFPGCLTSLTVSFAPATVACVARDLGASANASVLAGTATVTNVMTAGNVRAWIIAEKLGFE